jgi:Na+-transporting methylmalonyl-CoA/oxaloacetate decarboxylase gamma subunit
VTIIEQGLLISLLGLMLTFLALGMLILTIVVLQRLFKPKPAVSPKSVPNGTDPGEGDAELAAAMAAAILLLRAKDRRSSALGSTLENGPGRWWQQAQTVLSSPTQEHANGRDR